MYRAELADTIRGQQSSRPALPCVYCSAPTKSIYQVCCAHSDLIDLDPGHPAALVEARTPENAGACAGALRPPVRASTSAVPSSAGGDLTAIKPGARRARQTVEKGEK